MAVKMITAEELRTALNAEPAHYRRASTSVHAAACDRVKRYAIDAPIEVRNEAVILFSGWICGNPSAQSRSVFPEDGPPVNVSRAFLLSGAQSLLSSWRRPRAGACR